MGAFLLVLLCLSLAVAVLLLASRMRRTRLRFSTPGAVRLLGLAQLLIGGLWALWGVLYLREHGRTNAGGWYAVALGLLWCLQALRRLRLPTRR